MFSVRRNEKEKLDASDLHRNCCFHGPSVKPKRLCNGRLDFLRRREFWSKCRMLPSFGTRCLSAGIQVPSRTLSFPPPDRSASQRHSWPIRMLCPHVPSKHTATTIEKTEWHAQKRMSVIDSSTLAMHRWIYSCFSRSKCTCPRLRRESSHHARDRLLRRQ